MRLPSETEYETAKAALAVYADFSKAYLQPNGWTIIPTNALRPTFQNEELTTDRVNAFSTTVELFELNRDKPARFSAYVQEPDRAQRDATNVVACRHRNLTTWTGEIVGRVTFTGAWQRNNFGARWRAIEARSDWGAVYYGREYDSRQFINLKQRTARLAA